MTSKEKAKELKDKYMNVKWQIYLDDAKQCALIAVDEILKEVPTEILDTYKQQVNFIDNDRYYYWEEVKQEIEKL
jgi:hypothetical protein